MLLVTLLVWQLAVSACEKTRPYFGSENKLRPLHGESRGKFGKSLRFPATENVEDLLGLYEPSFLAQVWPKLKNGMHLTLKNVCWDDVTVLMKDLMLGRAWAYSVVDSSGRYEPGLLSGNRYWIGSKERCMTMDRRFRESEDNGSIAELRQGDYLSSVQRQQDLYGSQETWRNLMSQDDLMQRIVAADNTPPFRLTFNAVQVQLNLTKATMMKSHRIILGVCLPITCIASDVHELLDFSIIITDHLKSNSALPRSVKVIRVRPLDFDYSIASDSSTLILLIFTSLLVLLVVFATMTDLNLIRFMSHGSRSFNLEHPIPKSVTATSTMETKIMDLPSDRVHKNLHLHSLKPKLKQIAPSNISLVMPTTYPENATVNMDTRTIKNIDSKKNVNLVSVDSGFNSDRKPHSMTLDVVDANDRSNCRRCGKYRKQCQSSRQKDELSLRACPKLKYESYEVVTTIENEMELYKFDWNGFFKSMLLAFSLNLSIKKIFNTNGRAHSLNSVHGLKVISVLWIMHTHVAVVYSYLADNGADIGKRSYIHKTLTSGTYSFDTLLCISALLSAHHYFCLKNRYSTKELVNFGGVFGQIMQFTCFVTNRAVRLLPPYMFVIFMTSSVARRHHATSVLQLDERDYANCDKYWWRNVLYVNTFYPDRERCAHWSWYLSADTQLHLLGVLLLCVSSSRARLASVVTAALVVTAWATDSILAYRNQFNESITSSLTLYEDLLDRPWSRLGPYFVGLFTGWFLYHVDCKLYMNRIQVAVLWTATTIVLVTTGSGLFGLDLGEYGDIAYSSVSHTFWTLAVAWVIIASVTGYGGVIGWILAHKMLFPLSRLSYCVYLIHPVVTRAVLLTAGTTTHLDTGLIMVYYVGLAGISLLASLCLALLVEVPFSCLLRRAMECDPRAT